MASASLLERDVEVDCLDRLLDVASGGAGAAVVVEGEAGIGKTGLVGIARDRAAARGMQVLHARGALLEGELAFGVVREMFRRVVPETDDVTAAAGPVLGTSGGVPGDTRDLFAALHGLHRVVADLAAHRPVLLAVDDAHWSDVPSLRFLAYTARRMVDLPVALLVATRPVTDPVRREALDALTGEPSASVLRPNPLSPSAVGAMVAGVLGPTDPAFAAECTTVTGGNPFLLGELVEELDRAGVRPSTAEAGRVAAIVPHGVRRMAETRLARLSGPAAALARAAAVFGDGADARRAARLGTVDENDVAAAVDELVAARLVLPDRAMTFRHPLLRSAVQATIGPAELAAAHRRAAMMLSDDGADADALVGHLLAGQPAGDPWVVETLRTAARGAMSRGAPDVAARLLDRALVEPPPRTARHPLDVELGMALTRAGDARATGRFTTAVGSAPDRPARVRTRLQLARSLFHSGRLPQSVAVCEKALDELDGDEPALGAELEALLLAAATGAAATRPLALRRIAARTGDPQPDTPAGAMMSALLAVEEVLRPGTRERALDLARRAVGGGHLFDEQAVVTLPSALITLTLSGAPSRTQEVVDVVDASARRRGDVHGVAFAATFRGHAAHRLGDLPDALDHLRQAVGLARGDTALALSEAFAVAWLVDALLDAGELDAADHELAVNPELLRPDGPFPAVEILGARGRLRLAQRRYDDAVADLRECGVQLRRWGAEGAAFGRWRPHLASALRARGDAAGAVEVGAEAIRRAREWGEPMVLAEALRIGAEVLDDRRAGDLLVEAVDVAAAAPLERARALTALGGRLRRDGRRGAARERLRAALDLALARGAAGVAASAHDELLASGARPRRLRATGADALTATERRVALRAADGSTNRAVAQALFVSEKTVESHLHQVYRKLGITGRTQLAANLRAAPTEVESPPPR